MTDGHNFVAVIAYSYNAELICDFSNDSIALSNAIDRIDGIDRNGTNTYEGLLEASEILSSDEIPPGAIKNLILMTDGMPNQADATDVGPYTMNDCDYKENDTLDYTYRYANAVLNMAQEIKKTVNIYSLGFFQDFDSWYPHKDLDFAVNCLKDIQNSGYYEVTNADDFKFTFGNIAVDITKSDDNDANPVNANSAQAIKLNGPVDVYIYDSTGTLMGSIVDNAADTNNNNLILNVNNDAKDISFPDGNKYSIRIIGNAAGNFYYTVVTYQNGQEVKRAFFYNLPILLGEQFNGDIEGGYDLSEYTLVKNDDSSVIQASVCYENGYGAGINIVATAADQSGYVYGGAEYKVGDSVLLTANPSDGYAFDGWYADDVKVQDAGAKYSFTAIDDRTLEARFVSVENADNADSVDNIDNAVLDSIAVTTLPDKTVYAEGDTLDLSKMAVTATYSDGNTKEAAGYTTDSVEGEALNVAGAQTVTVYYCEGDVTKTAEFPILVN